MRGKLTLDTMRFYAHHGFFEEEQKVGGQYEVTVSVEIDMDLSAKTDVLENTINYQEIYDVVAIEMGNSSKLIENVAARILNVLVKKFPQILSIDVSLSKINPPLGAEVKCATISLHYPQ